MYAMLLAEADSVKLLLDAGAPFDIREFERLVALPDAAAVRIAHVMSQSLAQRRKALLELALRNLPIGIIKRLGLESDTLLDEKTFDVVQALRQRRVPVSAAYLVPIEKGEVILGSVYHWIPRAPFVAQALFEAGFHETNVTFRGYTPLMTILYVPWDLPDILGVALWFQDHGADMYSPMPIHDGCDRPSDINESQPIYPVIHKIMYAVGMFDFLNRQVVHPQIFSFMNDTITDPCVCYCTTNGCTSASKFIRGIIESEMVTDAISEMVTDTVSEKVLCRLMELIGGIYDHNGYRVAIDVIRVAAFELLEMKHTCCRYRWDLPFQMAPDWVSLLHLMNPDEITEIREEERYLAALLESLMEEFEVKLKEGNMTFSQFLRDYWLPRMQQVQEERDELSMEEKAEMRKIGVVLDES